jgi:hypothetical protein
MKVVAMVADKIIPNHFENFTWACFSPKRILPIGLNAKNKVNIKTNQCTRKHNTDCAGKKSTKMRASKKSGI